MSARLRTAAVLAAAGFVSSGAASLASSATAAPLFTDATEAAGLVYLQYDAPTALVDCVLLPCEAERMSGGAAVGDVDGDGLPDLFATRMDAPDLLFRNLGDGTFEEISESAGLAAFDLNSNGAGFADLDGDGDLDLYVTTIGAAGDPGSGRFYLFMNDGDGHFSEEAVARGAALATPHRHAGFSVAFGDYDGDGWVDLHTVEWIARTVPGGEPPHARLLRNLGAAAPGHFEDVTGAAGVALDPGDDCLGPSGRCRVWGFATAFTDLDADGCPDLAVAADFGTSRLFWNRCDGTFEDGTSAAGIGTDENGMGSTFGDIDGDGDLDWFVTSILDPSDTCGEGACGWGTSGNRLYRNEGSRSFTDATDVAGVRDGFWGWGAAFFDADNDRDQDLVMTNGQQFTGGGPEAHFHANPMRLWENDGTGAMTEVSAEAGMHDTRAGKGLVVFDFDGDGDLDVFVVHNGEAPRLYANETEDAGDWLRVELRGRAPNTEALGARIRVLDGASPQLREVGTATHFLGQSERVAHFGLGAGDAPVALVEVRWPDGSVTTRSGVARRSTLVLSQDEVAPPGVAMLGTLRLALRGLGKRTLPLEGSLRIAAGEWSFTDGATLVLTGRAEGRPGRFDLSLDADSLAALARLVEAEALASWGTTLDIEALAKSPLRHRERARGAAQLQGRVKLRSTNGAWLGALRLVLEGRQMKRPGKLAGDGV